MSTMKKRIPMFLLALAMMVAMALPTFAAAYRPNAQFDHLLNINGSTGSAYQGRALNLMKTKTMGTDQDFKIGTRSGYHRILSVSYTHLDVYKRQSQNRRSHSICYRFSKK